MLLQCISRRFSPVSLHQRWGQGAGSSTTKAKLSAHCGISAAGDGDTSEADYQGLRKSPLKVFYTSNHQRRPLTIRPGCGRINQGRNGEARPFQVLLFIHDERAPCNHKASNKAEQGATAYELQHFFTSAACLYN